MKHVYRRWDVIGHAGTVPAEGAAYAEVTTLADGTTGLFVRDAGGDEAGLALSHAEAAELARCLLSASGAAV